MSYDEGGETMEEVAQRSCGCPVVGQVGQGFEEPVLVEDVPAHGRWVGLMIFKGPFQPKPSYGSMKTQLLRQATLQPYQPVVHCCNTHVPAPSSCRATTGTVREQEGNRGTARGLSGVRQARAPLAQAMPPRAALRQQISEGRSWSASSTREAAEHNAPLLCGFSPSLPTVSLGGENTSGHSKLQGCVRQRPPPSSGVSAVLHPSQTHPGFWTKDALGGGETLQ